MKHYFSILTALSLWVVPLSASAAAVETVSLGGVPATYQNADGITSALLSVDDGGEVRIVEAGVYNPFTIPGGKTILIRGDVDGAVTSGTAGLAVDVDSTAGPVKVTLENLEFLGTIDASTTASANNQSWTVRDCEINAPQGRGWEMNEVHSDSTFHFVGTKIVAEEECIWDDIDGGDPINNNTWLVERCLFDNRGVLNGDRTVRFAYNATDPEPSTFKFYNCIFLYQEGPNGINARGLYFNDGNGEIEVVHCTFLAAGTGGGRAIFESFDGAQNGPTDVINCFFGNAFGDLTSISEDVVAGNIIVGEVNEGDIDQGSTFVAETGGFSAVLTNAGIDPVTFGPASAASMLVNAGDATQDYQDLIGGVDFFGNTRADGQPDVGAIEFGATAPVNASHGWTIYN